MTQQDKRSLFDRIAELESRAAEMDPMWEEARKLHSAGVRRPEELSSHMG